MNNQIISITELNPAISRKFKDPRLAEATNRIAAIYADAAKFVDTKNREIASILAEVMEAKSYEKDGFKSVGDYAKDVFGINRQNAYSLASAGKVYNDKNAPEALKAMTPSKLAEIAKVPTEILGKAITDGKITADATQKELREFASSVTAKPDKVEVLNKYTARACAPMVSERDADTYAFARTLPEWEEYFMVYMQALSPSRAPEIIKLTKTTTPGDTEAKKATVERRLFTSDNFSLVVEFYVERSKKAESKPKFTKEQLLAMLAELEK